MTSVQPPPALRALTGDPNPRDGQSPPNHEVALDAAADARLRSWLRGRVAERAVQRRRRVLHLRLAGGGLAVAAAMVLALRLPGGELPEGADAAAWQIRPMEGGTLTWLDTGGAAHRVVAAEAVRAPGELQTDSRTPAELITPRGVRLRMAPGTRLRPLARARVAKDAQRRRDPQAATHAATHQEVGLERGRVDVEVPPLGRRRSFAIRTHDAEVVVHGTRFRVEVQEAAGHRRTCVKVHEGRVEVRGAGGSRFLGAGDAHGCGADRGRAADQEEPRAASAGQDAVREPSITEASPSRSRRRARRAPVPALDGMDPAGEMPEPIGVGRLREQNRLLSEGLSAERNGELDVAERAFRRLLREHPDSPLGPDAQRGLSRVTAP